MDPKMKTFWAIFVLLVTIFGYVPSTARASPRPTTGPTIVPPSTDPYPTTTDSWAYLESFLQVTCDSHYLQVKIPTPDSEFSGMVYPQGLSKNSSCLKEYVAVDTIEYSLPLRSCNTMTMPSGNEEDFEYFNTIVLEPHPKLVTGHGKGFNVRCKLPKHLPNTPLVQMRILREGQDLSGDHVKIGDPLVLNITVETKQRYPFIITDCKVRDGLGWSEETLVNSAGCTVDSELMGEFLYTENAASVPFLAHKFPYSPSVYYACAVKICKDCHPPFCNARKDTRRKRDVNVPSVDEPATIEVYDGLYVNEVAENEAQEKADETRRERKASGAILCFNQRDFAVAIAISGLILMIAVILLIFILCFRRRRAVKGSESGGSSVYSGGYTNTAYSHSS